MGVNEANTRITLILVAVCVLLQIAIAPNMQIGSIAPNFLLIPVLSSGLLEGSKKGCIIGFSCGLLLDLCGTGPMGGMALVFLVVGFVCGLLSQTMFSEGWVMPIIIICLCALFANLAQAILLSMVGLNTSFFASLWQVVLPETFYDAILACVFFPLVRHFLAPTKRGMHNRNSLL